MDSLILYTCMTILLLIAVPFFVDMLYERLTTYKSEPAAEPPIELVYYNPKNDEFVVVSRLDSDNLTLTRLYGKGASSEVIIDADELDDYTENLIFIGRL